jgi:hypothetical protein
MSSNLLLVEVQPWLQFFAEKQALRLQHMLEAWLAAGFSRQY